MQNEIKHKDAIRYMLGGSAWVNVYSELSKEQRLFFILAVDDYDKTPRQVTNWKCDRYKVFYKAPGDKKMLFIGSIFERDRTRFDGADIIAADKLEYLQNFRFVWKHLQAQDLLPIYHIMHLGSCSVCNKPLKDAESLAVGIGPICRKRLDDMFLQSLLDEEK